MRPLESRRDRAVAYNDHDLIGRARPRGILTQRREVTAPARYEHAHPHHGSASTRSPPGQLTTRPMTRAPATALTISSRDAGAQTSANPMPMLNTRYISARGTAR